MKNPKYFWYISSVPPKNIRLSENVYTFEDTAKTRIQIAKKCLRQPKPINPNASNGVFKYRFKNVFLIIPRWYQDQKHNKKRHSYTFTN